MDKEKTIMTPRIVREKLWIQMGLFGFLITFFVLLVCVVPAVGGVTESVWAASISALAVLFLSLLAFVWTRLYVATLDYRITDRRILLNSGILFKNWKSIPFDKITDLVIKQGPVERYFGLKTILVQTAGTGTQRAEGALCGLADADKVRDKIVEARERYLRHSIKYGE